MFTKAVRFPRFTTPTTAVFLAMALLAAPSLGQDGGIPRTPFGTPDCEKLLPDLHARVASGDADEAAKRGRSVEASCHLTRGFLPLMAELAMARGDFDEAGRYLAWDMRHNLPDPSSFERLVSVFPRLGPDRQKEVLALGSDEKSRMSVPSSYESDLFIRAVLCAGKAVEKVDWSDVKMPGNSSFAYTCKGDSPRRVHLQFLEGMTSSRHVDVGPDQPMVDRILPALGSRFGLSTREQLREAVQGPVPPSQGMSWLLSFLFDNVRMLEIAREMLQRDPKNLQARIDEAGIWMSRGDLAAARAVLYAPGSEEAELRDTRGMVKGISALYTNRCRVSRLMGDLEQALEACRKSVALGSTTNGPVELAAVLFALGHAEEALASINSSKSSNSREPHAGFLRGAILQHLGRTAEAREAWAAVVDYGPVVTLKLEEQRKPRHWVQAMDDYAQAQWPYAYGACGHNYLDLGLEEHAEACFAVIRKRSPHFVDSERVDHLSETDPEGAVRMGTRLLRKQRHPAILRAVAAAQQRAGRPQQALALLDEALRLDAGVQRASEVLSRICTALKDPDCLKTFREARRAKPGR